LLQERTPDGYVFRIDLRLRPDPASTHIAISTTAALDSYESRGQNWARAALIKARPCAGDSAAGEALLAGRSPFNWRKCLDFAAAYRFLRVVENRLQMVADEQTHTLPADRDGLERFARFAGFPDRDAFARALLVHLRNVQRHYATLFENAPVIEAGQRTLLFPSEADDRETLDRLSEMGFRRPLETSALVRRWATGSYGTLKGAFARSQLAEIVPM